jgi:ABC-type lipoprotein release transport system permease subunit
MSMFQPLSFAIGLRYLRAKRRNGFISFISMASILGILIGVMALITTISVMNGFQEELRERILGMVSHATIDGLTASENRPGGSPTEGRACLAPGVESSLFQGARAGRPDPGHCPSRA